MTDLTTYYRDHWLDVEDERMARYEAMFAWRDGQEVLIAPAEIGEGQIVVDYGCGPGGLAVELARRVGSTGRVIGLDINADFLERTLARAADEAVAERIETRLVAGDRLPVDTHAVDRVVCKNVLEYVPDPQATIDEFHRILRPGGIAHVSDSDWGAVVFEPARERFARIMSAAAVAFRTPLIGRSLYGMFRRAGFSDVRVQVLAAADTTGALRGVLHNMAGYALTSGQVDKADVDAFMASVDRALDDETYLAVLPQFLVTGRVP
jgi:ubiquinone/menaquinone biosynthesis C-methylase UbiE